VLYIYLNYEKVFSLITIDDCCIAAKERKGRKKGMKSVNTVRVHIIGRSYAKILGRDVFDAFH
jgi:uncharacterized membrane protein